MGRSLGFEEPEKAPPGTNDRPFVAQRQSEDDQARVFLRRVGPDVSEAQVKSDERSPLAPADGCKVWVRGPAEALIGNAQCIMPVLDDQLGEIGGEILVSLESHAASSLGSEKTRSLARAAA